jgi:hypothetical protein
LIYSRVKRILYSLHWFSSDILNCLVTEISLVYSNRDAAYTIVSSKYHGLVRTSNKAKLTHVTRPN